MVVALLVIALAMIAGGLAAVLQGWDIVLLEHGWSLVVAGSVFASGGAVLLGLAATVFRLGHLHRELVTIRDRSGRAEFERIAPPPIDPVAAIAAGGLAATGLAGDAPKEQTAGTGERPTDEDESRDRELQPGFPTFLTNRDREEAAATTGTVQVPPGPAEDGVRAEDRTYLPENGTRLNLPENLLGPSRPTIETRRQEPELEEQEDEEQVETVDLFSEQDAKRAEQTILGRSELPDRQPEPAGTSDEEHKTRERQEESDDSDAAAEPASSIVGTYTSGDNRYVMFADGSIEADTPHGIFRFESLDELKSFIASGGERPARDE